MPSLELAPGEYLAHRVPDTLTAKKTIPSALVFMRENFLSSVALRFYHLRAILKKKLKN